jgi:hypothetical protein
MFDNEMFFHIEAEVVKNLKWQDYVDVMVNEDKVKYQLTLFKGGLVFVCTFPHVIVNMILS